MLASPIGPPRPPSLRPDSGPTVGPDWPHDCPPHDAIRASSHEHEMPIETAPGPRAAELDAALFARPPCRPSPEILAQLAHDAGSAPSLPTRQVAAAGQAAAASWRHQKHPFSIRLALQAVVACLVSSSREPRCPPQSRIDRHDDPLSLSLSPADRPGPPPISPLTVLAAVIGLGLGLAYLYRAALPKPLPGIPYNKDSARRLFGDVKAIRQSTYRRRWIWSQPRLHRSPISQAFLFPFRRPTVIVSDYRTAVDICSRRIKEFDRGTRNRDATATSCAIS
ncbi:hypothetical protein CDD83_4794 [Cordyceps sp. RAO-2017]|nr:hypothetical protein CDD83_4794 [Cordyceps sp. RAO-2017]